MITAYLIKAVPVILILILLKITVKRIIIFEYEKGLKYSKGRFKGILEAGEYWYISFFSSIQKLDLRPRFVSIPGQELLSSDGVTLKVSLAAKYQIADPLLAVNSVQNYEEALYLELQMALREIIGSADIDKLLEKRNEYSKQLHDLTEKKTESIGIKLISVNIKDIMFPGQLKEIFTQAVRARKEGEAALEKARGETAALRNLANAAKMLESNPNLMQLRMIQAFSQTSGNTMVFGMPAQPLGRVSGA